MKRLILLCIVASLALAKDISYDERSSLESRATTCDNNNNNNNRQLCSSAGNQCTRDCTSCLLSYTNCTADAMNTSMRCDCETSFVNCLATFKNPSFVCNSSDAYQSCKADLPSCSCGTPYTVDNTLYICNSNAYCDQSSGKCTAVKGVGQTCKTSDECGNVNANPLFADTYNCTNNKCQIITKSWPGDACSSNSDCRLYAQYNLGCVSGVCASQKDGSECPVADLDQVCGSGLFCDEDNLCRTVMSIGESCNATTRAASFAVCGLTGICSAGSCVNFMSKNQDQACQYDEECASPMYCSQSRGVCSQPLSNPVCNSDLYCTQLNSDYYGCECAAGATTPTCQSNADTKCTQQALNFLQCAQSNNCVVSESYVPGGCADMHCRQELECYADCSGATEIYDAFCIVGYTSTCPAVSFAERNQAFTWTVVASVVAAVIMF